ncbi:MULTISPECIES: YjgB family protein [Paenibacillus]|uniref:YjgB family protein n=1 Tax=Paenibacillus TaxID=44249 RepID=UPI000955DB10|nr:MULTISPECIES: YjgB family protein [Paenibacillus]ASS67061.1 YjgB family protein [Paenibacillus sp. RUD330]SIQ91368.1 protein of unknown function [Paenibacillus sp. RU4X]SIR12249.1 protein of unknown function [Paenibacillus sp. RU4T]
MNMQWTKKTAFAVLAAGVLASAGSALPFSSAHAAASTAAVSAHDQAAAKLNSFYKPALKGQFPDFNSFTVGKTTRQTVVKTIGAPMVPMKDSDGFDVYTADMGHPGYAFNYKLGKIREMRYFGTNVERQTNIGSITVKLLVQQWGAPDASVIFKTGKTQQKKISYVRGDYQLDFIFNNINGTDCAHINLKAKTLK